MTSALVYRILAVLLLAGVAAGRYASAYRPPHVEQYHAKIRDAGAAVPARIGPWVGQDVTVPAQAIRVLAPNVIISRKYLNIESGLSAGVLFVHCADAHDMAGHFPLRCYPAAGWDLKTSRTHDWSAGGLALGGMEYEFTRGGLEAGGGRGIVVANCLFRPGGQVLRDMDAMTRLILGAGGQSSGAGQLQVYFDPGVPQDQRDAAVEAIVAGYKPLLEAVLAKP